MGIDLINCHFETSGHAAFILHSSILNHFALSINAIYHILYMSLTLNVQRMVIKNHHSRAYVGRYGSPSARNNKCRKIAFRLRKVVFIYHEKGQIKRDQKGPLK